MTKRIIGLVLALCLVVGLLPMIALAEQTHTHTPVGAGTELADQRVNASLDAKGTVYGKYVMQYTCADCGQTYTEDVAFGPALLHYKTVAQDSSKNTAGDPVEATNYNTWGVANAGNDYKPCVVMNPGDAARYFVTKGGHATFINNSYVEELKDADKIAAGEWNMKLEYPVLGTPTLTLKGANITNTAGLWLGRGAYTTSVDYKIVIEEDSTIAQTCSYNGASDKAVQGSGNLNLMTTGTVTIAGPGKLTLVSSSYGKAAIYSTLGDIILDSADIKLTKLDSMLASRTSDGIYTKNNNLTIKNSKVDIFCYMPSKSAGGLDSYRGLGYSLYAGKALTIDTSDVDIAVSMSGSNASSPFAVYGADVTFKDSDVAVSHGGVYYGKAIGYKNSFTAEYTNGYTAYNSGSKFSYNKETGAVTYPTGKAFTDLTADNLKKYFVEFKHNCFDNTDDFDCTAADTCDLCGKTIGEPDATAHTPAADDGDCTTDILCANEGCKQVATPAATAHTPGTDDDGDCSTPVMCTNPGCQQIAVSTAHVPGADDGDCSTAIKCSVCGAEATPAKTHKYTDGADTTCDNDGCEYTRVILTATLTIASGSNDAKALWKPTLSEGMAPAYAKTVDGIIVTTGASESDYNLKVEWPEGGKPTLTLKNATINNDNIYPNKADTISIDGSADFVIDVQGTNTLNCYPANSGDTMNQKVSAYKCPFGIRANNTGELIIRGESKATDSLAIHSWGGNGFTRYYGATTIENIDFSIRLYKNANAASYSAHGLLLMCGESGKYNDKMDLAVRNCNFLIDVNKNYGAKLIVVGVNNDTASATNTSDILFQNSVVSLNRNNSSGQSSAAVHHGADTTITFDRCDVSTCYAWRIMFTYMPTITNYATATYREEISSSKYEDKAYDPALAGTSIKLRNVKMTHACIAADDDFDCTTATVCDMCGQAMGEVQTAHTGVDDGDCTTAVKCANPGCDQIAVEAKASHTPEADDGDCTTAIKCSLCGTETTAAASAHVGGTATCKDKAKCTTCGKEYGEKLTTHVPNADDGDCTTAITCSICGTETTPAATHTGGTATCKDKAKCATCGKEYGEKLTTHTPDTRTDCTVDTMCTVCGEVAIAAGSHTGGTATCKDKAVCTVCNKAYGELLTTHVPNADDGDCTTAITCSICGVETTAAKTAHTGGTATCKDKAKCTECGKEYGELLTTHVPNADDGDCTTAITCSICGVETTAAKTAHTGGTATCKAKAKCATCGKEYGELKAHTPAADDGDCTTAIKCSVCGTETTAAAAAHSYTDDKDTTCNATGCTNSRTVVSNPQTGDSANLPLLFVLMLISAAGIIAMGGFFVFTKLRKREN